MERRTGMVLMVRFHPPEILPESGLASSTANRLQVPLGSTPLKADRVARELELPDGAGGGRSNSRYESLLVGLNVPETKGASRGRGSAASSSSVSVRLVTA